MGNTVWTGTQLGYSLSGCRLGSGNVLLAFNEFATDANTVGLWHMNEAAWVENQADCLDSSAHANHLTALGTGCNTFADSWMGRGGDLNATGRALGRSGVTNAPTSGPWTLEGWVWWNGVVSGTYRNVFAIGFAGTYMFFYLDDTTAKLVLGVGADRQRPGRTMPSQTWTHYAITCDGSSYTKLWENGVLVATSILGPYASSVGIGRVAGSYVNGQILVDECRWSSVNRYPSAFSPIRYPASGTGTPDPATGVACNPGLLTVALAEALPTGTALKAKLLSTTGGDTGFQVLTGSGTTYTYDFTGQANGSWYPAVQLFAGGALNINTPTVTQVALDWTLPAAGRFALMTGGSMRPSGIFTGGGLY